MAQLGENLLSLISNVILYFLTAVRIAYRLTQEVEETTAYALRNQLVCELPIAQEYAESLKLLLCFSKKLFQLATKKGSLSHHPCLVQE